MINGTHAIIYSRNAGATRDFFRDVLGLRSVDAGKGWLIFALPPAELGIHPDEAGGTGGRHELYLMCDDINRTVEELKGKGVEFTGPVSDQGWGLLATFRIPGTGEELSIYQPRHPTTIAPARKARAVRKGASKKKGARMRRKRGRAKGR
jgi:catechol 2,3-dioxygenase-like lactoylglutathione lyase family enzyme